jgi:hypothetical protein
MTHLSKPAARLSDTIPTNSEGGINSARLSVGRDGSYYLTARKITEHGVRKGGRSPTRSLDRVCTVMVA